MTSEILKLDELLISWKKEFHEYERQKEFDSNRPFSLFDIYANDLMPSFVLSSLIDAASVILDENQTNTPENVLAFAKAYYLHLTLFARRAKIDPRPRDSNLQLGPAKKKFNATIWRMVILKMAKDYWRRMPIHRNNQQQTAEAIREDVEKDLREADLLKAHKRISLSAIKKQLREAAVTTGQF